MSHCIDEHYRVYRETLRCARKPHRCDACRETIAAGHRYYSIAIVWEGVESVKRCLKCQAIHEHLRYMDPGVMWPDERLDCGEEYEDHWGAPPPDDIARLAFMTPDEAQKELSK